MIKIKAEQGDAWEFLRAKNVDGKICWRKYAVVVNGETIESGNIKELAQKIIDFTIKELARDEN